MLVSLLTDPLCPHSWAAEPVRRELEWDFDGALSVRPVMGGLIRELALGYEDAQSAIAGGRDPIPQMVAAWLRAADGGMPFDPRLWHEAPPRSSHPASMAVCAAGEQGRGAAAAYLRAVREKLICERRKLDHLDALVAVGPDAGIDAERFAVDCASHAIVERFGADLAFVGSAAKLAGPAAVRTGGRDRPPFPSWLFGVEPSLLAPERELDPAGSVWGPVTYEQLREAAITAGAEPTDPPRPDPVSAVESLGRLATAEIVALSRRPWPIVEAELWSAARDWRLRPVRVLGGWLWERAS